MTLENPSFIEDFNPAAPTFQDFQAEGDDHLRNMKRAIKATFPGFAGRFARRKNVTASGALTLQDNGSLIRATQTLILTPAAAASIGNGWMVFVRAEGGTVTIDPTANEKVNGLDTIAVPSGYTAILFCDGTEFFSMLVYTEVPTAAKAFPTGTRMLFQQTAAPLGWTKITVGVYDNAGLRLTTGAVGTGGVDAFTSTFGSGKVTAGHTLSIAQIPSHTHPGGGTPTPAEVGGGPGYAQVNTGATGGGGSHTHPLNNMNLKYADAIIASID
jgi:hypothetical protein